MFPFATSSHRYILSSLLLACLLAVAPRAADADTLTVSITDDAGPGSLRQAILDANANTGPDDIVFNIPQTDARFNGAWWTILVTSELPALMDSGTRILGSTQTANQGDLNAGMVGSGGTVGIDAMTLPQYNRPEIEINAGDFNGLTIGAAASDILIEGVAVVNAVNGIVAQGHSAVGVAAANRVVQSVLVGVFADGNDPAALRNTGHGIVVEAPGPGLPSTSLTVQNAYVGYNGEVGVLSIRGETVLDVSFSEVFMNGQLSDAHDGIDVNGLPSIVRYNLSYGNTNLSGTPNSSSGHGIEAGSQDPGTGGHMIENNTVHGNLGAGIALRAGSSDNVVMKNIAFGNTAGVYVNGESQGQTDGNLISQNSTYGNNGLGIDLHGEIGSADYDGVTLNSPSSGQGGSNRLVAYPVIETAELRGDTLIFAGFAQAGGVLEVFEAAADPTGFGEGDRYLFTVEEGSADDTDATTGTYGPTVNQFVVSTEALTSNRFEFTVVVPGAADSLLITASQTVTSPTSALGKLVSTNTSEFGPIILAEDNRSPVAAEPKELPGEFKLLGAYPNPFNPATTIAFELEKPGLTSLRIFNARGAEVAHLVDETMSEGSHRVSWDANGLPSGIYFYRLTVNGNTLSGSATLLK